MPHLQKMVPPPTISTAKATNMNYQQKVPAVGTLEALNGVNITPRVSGEVVHIFVHSGQVVHKGQPILLLDNRAAKASYLSDQAAFQNAVVTLQRDERLIKAHAISQTQYDADFTAFKEAKSAMNAAAVALRDHTVKAPFSGKLGIRQVNIGQFINPGESIIALQTQNPIHFNFNLAEKNLANLNNGTKVDLKVDRFPNIVFHGKVTSIDSTIDPATHTIAVQATFPNNKHLLFPGGFGTGYVYLGQAQSVLAIPNTAITYRLYGDSVYLVSTTNAKGKPVHTATLKYITLGDPINADYTEVTKGLKAGDLVVTAGQNKLQEKNVVSINNNAPTTNANPFKKES